MNLGPKTHGHTLSNIKETINLILESTLDPPPKPETENRRQEDQPKSNRPIGLAYSTGQLCGFVVVMSTRKPFEAGISNCRFHPV